VDIKHEAMKGLTQNASVMHLIQIIPSAHPGVHHIKVRVKFNLKQTIVAQRVSRGIALLLL
jgi:hypothetical protein